MRIESSSYSNQLIAVFVVALAASIAPQMAGAQTRERSGKEVVDSVCAACHRAGVNGAPRIGDEKAWAKLASRSLTDLTESALRGVRSMPAHGGDSKLTDVEIERAITHMVNLSGGRWIEPDSGLTPATERRGAQVVQAQCAKCHQAGLNGAPKIGDREAWIPRLKRGLDALVRSAVRGHGPMPPRGGMAGLTESELRGAIVYMFNPVQAGAKGASAPPPAVPGPNLKIVDGMEVHLGILSAESMRMQYAKGSREASMHGGIPAGRDYYHVNVSLFDTSTKAAIANAQVEASVREPVSGGDTKVLEPVTINNIRSYGNYFRMPGTNPYTITVRIRKPGEPRTVEARFDHKH